MEIKVLYVDGPAEYAGRVVPAEPLAGGLLRETGSVFGGPEAWYRVDLAGEPVLTDEGPAQPAHYIGTARPEADAEQS